MPDIAFGYGAKWLVSGKVVLIELSVVTAILIFDWSVLVSCHGNHDEMLDEEMRCRPGHPSKD